MGRRLRWAWLWVMLVACRAASEADLPDLADDEEMPSDDPLLADRDADGLCDQSEAELGTDPDRVDGDDDGMPDLVEITMGYDPGDALVPDATQVAYMATAQGSEVAFEVSVSVQGQGEALSGAYQPRPPIFELPQTARDFYTGAVAVSADPVDNVREQSVSGARFGAVLGPARLRFQLRFEQGLPEADLPGCVVPHPFGFTIKTDDGMVLSSQEYLLVVGPSDDLQRPDAYCLPRACF